MPTSTAIVLRVYFFGDFQSLLSQIAMAASDNVIRGCLTPKYIDKETLAGVRSIIFQVIISII